MARLQSKPYIDETRETDAEKNYSIGTYKSNTVTISHSLTSSAAGSLDASSTVNIANDDVNVYNINFANSYGLGAQVSVLIQFIST